MSYIRKRGKQLCLVHGTRNPESKQVEQKILFTFYSKAEVREALGSKGDSRALRFDSLLDHEYPGIRFDWKRIRKELEAQMDVLPDIYPCQETRMQTGLREAMTGFLRELAVADPFWLSSARKVLQENQTELAYLLELISDRLANAEKADHSSDDVRFPSDNKFFWRYTLRGNSIPPETEEALQDAFNAGDDRKADRLFAFYTDAFPSYADGFNYRGLLALRNGDLETAKAMFLNAVEVGRTLFPKRIAKSSYWVSLETRPYMRGLRNLTLTLIRIGDYEQALVLCDRLETECGDEGAPQSFRAAAYLNQGRWREAYDTARPLVRFFPSEAFIAAFAAFENGRRALAMWHFVHGLMNNPRTASILTRTKTPGQPKTSTEAEDHNHGVDTLETLTAFLKKQSPASRRYFREIVELAEVRALKERLLELERRRNDNRATQNRESFLEMRSLKDETWLREYVSPIFKTRFGPESLPAIH